MGEDRIRIALGLEVDWIRLEMHIFWRINYQLILKECRSPHIVSIMTASSSQLEAMSSYE